MRYRLFIKNRLIPVVFLILLTMPFINKYLPIIEIKESKENRTLSAKPVLNVNSLNPYPLEYEAYYNDNFTFRNNYIRFYNFIRFRYLKVNPYPKKVVLGKDEWLFYNDLSLPRYKANKQFSSEQLKLIAEELVNRQDYLAAHNCRFYLGIIPAKASVYFDKLEAPFYKPAYDTIPSRAEQLINYLNNNTDIKASYLRDSLVAYKNKHVLYRKYDHHWNEMGGFIASRSMLWMVQDDFPDLKMSIDLNDYRVNYPKYAGGDLAQLIGVQEYCYEKHPSLKLNNKQNRIEDVQNKDLPIPEGFAYGWGYEVRKTTNNSELPNCMVIRDSFGSYYKDFLSRGFNNTLFLWDKWEYKLNKEIFLEEQPDVLIIMIPESSLQKFIPEGE